MSDKVMEIVVTRKDPLMCGPDFHTMLERIVKAATRHCGQFTFTRVTTAQAIIECRDIKAAMVDSLAKMNVPNGVQVCIGF